MNMPVTHVSHPRAMVERNWPLWREIIDTVMERCSAKPRTKSPNTSRGTNMIWPQRCGPSSNGGTCACERKRGSRARKLRRARCGRVTLPSGQFRTTRTEHLA